MKANIEIIMEQNLNLVYEMDEAYYYVDDPFMVEQVIVTDVMETTRRRLQILQDWTRLCGGASAIVGNRHVATMVRPTYEFWVALPNKVKNKKFSVARAERFLELQKRVKVEICVQDGRDRRAELDRCNRRLQEAVAKIKEET